jgi:hypothetical protein
MAIFFQLNQPRKILCFVDTTVMAASRSSQAGDRHLVCSLCPSWFSTMFHAGGIASGPSGIRIWRCATDVPSFRDFATHYRLADIHKHTAEPRIGISRFVVDDSVSSTLRSRSRLVLICTTSCTFDHVSDSSHPNDVSSSSII